MDAITLLKNDHVEVRGLLSDLEATSTRGAKKRQSLLDQIETALVAHTTIEEEIFYPAFKEAGGKSDDEKLYFEALEEHRAAGELVLPDLKGTDPASEEFSGRAKVLKELVEHHADEEEKKCSLERRNYFREKNSRSSAKSSKREKTNCYPLRDQTRCAPIGCAILLEVA